MKPKIKSLLGYCQCCHRNGVTVWSRDNRGGVCDDCIHLFLYAKILSEIDVEQLKEECEEQVAKDMSESKSTLTVTIVDHPKGFLMRLEHDGAAMTLDRDEAIELYEKLSEKLGELPVKV